MGDNLPAASILLADRRRRPGCAPQIPANRDGVIAVNEKHSATRAKLPPWRVLALSYSVREMLLSIFHAR
jgi:hypothetical protein